MEIGQDTREALEPEAERLSVVALTTDRVGAEEAVVDVRRDRSQQFIPPMIVDVVEALSDPPLDDRTVMGPYVNGSRVAGFTPCLSIG